MPHHPRAFAPSPDAMTNDKRQMIADPAAFVEGWGRDYLVSGTSFTAVGEKTPILGCAKRLA